MCKEFKSGFTEFSYFNILMDMGMNLYDDAINNSINLKNNTKGLDFAYIEDEGINANVWFDPKTGYDHMRINTGTITEIFSYFKSAFCNKSVFCNIGDISKENNDIVKGKFDSLSYSTFYTGEPQDTVRRQISDYASLFALRFVFAHELGHLLNGHSYYLGSLYAISNIDMRGKRFFSNLNKKIEENYALDRRTLEMDADAFAATCGMDNIIMLYQKNDEPGILFEALNKPIEIFKLWSFSIHSVFLLFEGISKTTYSKSEWYLPNEAREMLVMSSAICTLDSYAKNKILKCDDKLNDEIIKNLSMGIIEAERYYNLRFGTKFDFISQTMDNPKYNLYAQEVLDYWDNDLYKKIKRYSRCHLYNPKTIDKVIKNIK